MSGLIKRLCGISAFLLLAAAVHAELQLLENFNGRPSSTPDNSAANGVLGGFLDTESETSGNISIRQGPEGDNPTVCVRIDSSGDADGDERGLVVTGANDPIGPGEVGVLFFRFRHAIATWPVYNWYGMTYLFMDEATDNALSGTNENDEDELIRAGFLCYRQSNIGTDPISIRTISSADNVGVEITTVTPGQWYDCWIDVDNGAGTFDLYIEPSPAGTPGGSPPDGPTSDPILDDHPFYPAATSVDPTTLYGWINQHPDNPPRPWNGKDAQAFSDDIYWDGSEGLTLVTRKAQNPTPENRATMVPVEQVLSWEAPNDPNVAQVFGYDVYLDPNEAAVAAGLAVKRVSTNQPGTSFDATGILTNEEQWYWRVDSRIKLNDPNQTEYTEPGKVWTFTTVPMTPVIMQQPLNQVRGVKNGKPDAVFTVEAVNATSYQWRKNGSPISDGGNVSGAITATLTIANVGQADEGQYSCLVSNGPSNAVTTDTVWLEFARQTCQWDFEDTYAADPVIGGPTLVPVAEPNAPSFEEGKIGLKAVKFAGDWAMIPAEALPRAGTEITISFWAKTTVTGRTVLYASTLAAPTTRLLNIHIPWSSNIVYFDISNPAETAYDRVGSSAITPVNEWVQWTLTKDVETGLMRIYRDGQQLAQAANLHRRLYGVEQFFLGKGILTSGVDACFDGLVDNLRIYNYYMDEVEAAYLYSDSSGLPVCVYPTDATLQAYDYDNDCRIGVGDLVNLANNWLYDQLVP